MRSVRQVLQAKSPELYVVHPDTPVINAIRLMADRQIGALPVVDDGRLVGVISERDYARKVVLMGRSSSSTAVREIMSHDVTTVRPDDTVEHCMLVVTHRRLRHLPVMVDGRLTGIVSIGDLVKAVIEDQQLELDQLQRYIAS